MSNVWSIDIETAMGATESVRALRKKDAEKLSALIEADKLLPNKNDRKILDKRYVDPKLIEKDAEKKIREANQLDRSADALNPLTAVPICIVCVPVDLQAKDLDFDIEALDPLIMEKTQRFFKVFTGDQIPAFYDWAKAEVNQFLGFNIDQFDIPCLRLYQARTSNGVVPRILAFWNHSIDLRREFGDVYNKGEVYSTPRSLLYYVATILDHEAQVAGPVREYLESDFTGADVAAAYVDWGEGGKEKIIRHCTLDALMPALIAVKLGIYR